MVAGGMKLVKYLLFFFNFLFFISGIALIVVGALVQANVKDYLKLLDGSFSSPPILCIVVGVLITLIGFFGCCGAIKENYCMTMTFAVLLSIILILELAAGILAYTMKGKVENLLEKNSLKAIKYYHNTEDKYRDFRNAIDDVQKNFDCCGFNGPDDWVNSTAPYTCCKKDVRKEGCEKNNDNIESEGCKKSIEKFVKDNIYYIGGVGIALAVIQVLGILLSCCLASSIKKEYEVV